MDAAAEPLRQNLAAFLLPPSLDGCPRREGRARPRPLDVVLARRSPGLDHVAVGRCSAISGLRPSDGCCLTSPGRQHRRRPSAHAAGVTRRGGRQFRGIEPVVTIPQSLRERHLRSPRRRGKQNMPPRSSQRGLHDRASPFGATYATRDGSRRRSDSRCCEVPCALSGIPSFSISNEVAYGNLMVQATPPRESEIGRGPCM